MYERMLDKSSEPTMSQIKSYIGEESYLLLTSFEKSLKEKYLLTKELRFPFGNSYGWGYKYGHKSTHLCYAFFENGCFTVMIQIGDKQVPKVESILNSMSQKNISLWENRYPCGNCGGWIQFRVLGSDDLSDILQFVEIKKKPNK